MKRAIAIMVLFVLASASLSVARNNGGRLPHISTLPDTRLLTHRDTDIKFTVSNFGILGSLEGEYHDYENPNDTVPGFEFPSGSGINYLFVGSIWIGAEIDTVNAQGQPILDTLVSVGVDGWWNNIYEFFPGYPPCNCMWRSDSVSDEDITAIYSDTITNPGIVMPDPYDGPHIPLGVEITQVSRGWNTIGFNDFFVVDYYIHNVSNRNLHNVWFAIYNDGDVYHNSEMPYGIERGAQDDLCGFVEHGNNGIAWIADNNGQPDSMGLFDQHSATGVYGMTILRPAGQGMQTNFNWWMSNIYSQFDWGPQLQTNFDRWGDFPGGGRGTPGGDKAKYEIMSNGEHDYDQARSALDHPEWITPPANIVDIANGYDTRFLLSFGPLQIAQGAVETVAVAIIGGNSLHVNESNYDLHLKNHENDSAFVDEFYQGLDFSDLISKVDSANFYFQSGLLNIPPGPPHNFILTAWSENQINLAWNARHNSNIREYRIYRRRASEGYGPNPITPPGFLDTSFVDNTVEDNTQYYYAVASVTISGIQGGLSQEVAVNSGRPHKPSDLVGANGNNIVELSWAANEETDLAGYIIQRESAGIPFETIDTTRITAYDDSTASNGHKYYYQILAFDTLGNVSPSSDSVMCIPMAFDSGVLLLNDNTPVNVYPYYDSLLFFYLDILADYNFYLRSAFHESLVSLSPYSTLIWCRELPNHSRQEFDSEVQNVLGDYLEAGGNLIIAGPRIFANNSTQGQIDFDSHSFPGKYFNLAGAVYPNLLDTSFVGGNSLRVGYPNFSLDTLRVRQIDQPVEPGHVFGLGTFIPFDTSEVIYAFVGNGPDSFNLQNQAIATVHHAANFNTAILDFPLYYVQEPQSYQILHAILNDFGEVTGIQDNPIRTPGRFSLANNYPNPFNLATTLKYNLPSPGHVSLTIYNLLGQKVVILFDGEQIAGEHSISWRADKMPSGIYFARLEAGGKAASIKMMLLK